MARTIDSTVADAELAARLRLAVMRLARRLRQQADGDVTPSQISALASVDRLGPLTLGELSAVERVQPPTMTRIVSGLEEQGLATREVDVTDRRVARVHLTVAGRRLLEQSRTRKNAFLASRIRTLAADDRDVLARAAEILERLLETEE
jgi:DNA-binding MarR family transcriptional regulator